MTPAIVVKQVSFSYRHQGSTDLITLQDINFDVVRGETLGVVGRNGAGKSTLLRLLAGVLEPASGAVHRAPGVRCGLLSLGVGFMPDLTGADNVVISLMLQGLTRAEARSRLQEIAEFSDLGDAFYNRVKTYSSGMRSRLTFSTALFNSADVLLIDEVLSVGDGAFRQKAHRALRDKISGDQTVVFVSHVESAVQQHCDRVVWIEEGKVLLVGETAEVLENYRQSFS